jgi:hypothetical protein
VYCLTVPCFLLKHLRHLEGTHTECTEKYISYFKWNLKVLKNCQNLITSTVKTNNKNATVALYEVSYHTVLAGEVHTTVKTLSQVLSIWLSVGSAGG